MKRTTFFQPILILCLLAGHLWAQNDAARPLEERIETQRIAFITDKVNLTREEAQKFWPIYNDYRDHAKQLRERKVPSKSLIDMDDDEALEHIEKQLAIEREELQLKEELMQDLKTVISPRKILRFINAERKFKERLLQMMNQRRRQSNK